MLCRIADSDWVLGDVDQAAWHGIANGATLCITTLVNNDGVITVQLERLQNTFARVRRAVARIPIAARAEVLVGVYAGGAWTYRVRKLTAPPELFLAGVQPESAITPWVIPPGVAALRKHVAQAFPSEGRFLDWLAYKSHHGWCVDTIHDLTEAQALLILTGFELGGIA